MILTDKLSNIADAIRSKTGKSEEMTLDEMPVEIESISGNKVEKPFDCHSVTFVYGDKSYVRSVADGDTCADPVARELIPTPTKESTAQYNYTYYGWGASDGGAADANILKNITEDKTVYAIFTATVKTYTITFYDSDGTTVLATKQVAYGTKPSYTPVKNGYAFSGWTPALVEVTGDASYTAQWTEMTLELMSWEEIAQISEAGTAANYFAVGDKKTIKINGKIGASASYSNQSLQVYIIGIYHNSEVEGSGIHFSGFYDTTYSKDVGLYDSWRKSQKTDGTKTFNIYHWGNANKINGWAGSDLRYDILGSTDVKPSGYGAAPTSSRVGYDATETCATNPVANTLMSCLPADLRSVLKPITKWTSNGAGSAASLVTATKDYLPLISLYEMTAMRLYGTSTSSTYGVNAEEMKHQKQYDYFKNGGVIQLQIRYSNGAWGNLPYWLRSPEQGTYTIYYSAVNESGSTAQMSYSYSLGLRPIFMV